MASQDEPGRKEIHLRVPPRLYILPGAGMLAGCCIGIVRGSRRASLRFLAENAHRPPTTVKGWYLYNKTKNYRVILGGLKEAGVNATKLGAITLSWASIEEGLQRAGWGDVSELGAGVGTAGMWCAIRECNVIWTGGCFKDVLYRQIGLEDDWADVGAWAGRRRDDEGIEMGTRTFAGEAKYVVTHVMLLMQPQARPVSATTSKWSLASRMTKFWPDQLTPKASAERPNPFDVHNLLNTGHRTPSSRPSAPSCPPASPSGLLTPTGNIALPALSLHAPVFNMHPPPTPLPSSSSSPIGQIHVKLIQARSLNVRSIHGRPYVVVQFEQNEFVSRDPTDETDKEVKGTAINLSRNNSSVAISALGAIGNKVALDAAKRKGGASSSPPPPPHAPSRPHNSLFGRLSAHNPVWKHEVSL
jgi:hypothetical protein